MATVINLYNLHSTSSPLTTTIRFPSYFTNRVRHLLDGLPGKVRRSQTAKYTLDSSYPETAPGDYEEVTKFAETGMRVTYMPENFQKEVEAVGGKWKGAVKHASQFNSGFRMKRSKDLEKAIVALVTKL